MEATIKLTQREDGSVTIETEDGQEPLECKDLADAFEKVEMIFSEESAETAQEESAEPKEDYAAMWDQEAQARPKQPGLMA